jgi:hypothetical protein
MGIVLLIRHGADLYAEDYDGQSVSHTAYSAQSEERVGLGCVTGDVWDFALAISGYSISAFRQGHGRRRACYGRKYTRRDFENLWVGREHLCPYYDDVEYFWGDADTMECSSSEDEEGSVTTDSEDGGADVVDFEDWRNRN